MGSSTQRRPRRAPRNHGRRRARATRTTWPLLNRPLTRAEARRVRIGGAFLLAAAALALVAALLSPGLWGGWPRRMVVTAYCPCTECCGPNAVGITASGKPVSANGQRFVAADRSVPFGTMLTIPGYTGGRPVEVLDRGGAIRGNRLDVYFPTHREARQWGVRKLVVDAVEKR